MEFVVSWCEVVGLGDFDCVEVGLVVVWFGFMVVV